MLFNIKYAFQGKQHEEIIPAERAEKAIEIIKGVYEQERVAIGMFAHCHGHGEFEVLINNDVEVED